MTTILYFFWTGFSGSVLKADAILRAEYVSPIIREDRVSRIVREEPQSQIVRCDR